MRIRTSMLAALACAAMAFPAAGAPPGSDDLLWYYDADTALEAARRSERPIVLLKIRADIGPDVKT
jgi:hypothetical protein